MSEDFSPTTIERMLGFMGSVENELKHLNTSFSELRDELKGVSEPLNKRIDGLDTRVKKLETHHVINTSHITLGRRITVALGGIATLVILFATYWWPKP